MRALRTLARAAAALAWAVAALMPCGEASACSTCAAPELVLPAPTGAFQRISGATTFACPSDFYALDLVAGAPVELTLCLPGSATYDSRLRLRSPGCVLLSDNDDYCGLQSRILMPAVATAGRHVVEVTGFTQSSSGAYVLAYRQLFEATVPGGCTNGLDDDGDGLADCASIACTDDPACVESCGNGVDDDADGLVDCEDRECTDDAACPELCWNSADDDADGAVDCADSECVGDPGCLEAGRCDDRRDNDADRRTDCADSDCADFPACIEADHCDNRRDDDVDGLTDCADPDCAAFPACIEAGHCVDGRDNDMDGRADCADSECAADAACIETGNCQDLRDNDADGRADCRDSDCATDPACDEASRCDDGLDNDFDGSPDCLDADCAAEPACARVMRASEPLLRARRYGDGVLLTYDPISRDAAGTDDRIVAWRAFRGDAAAFTPDLAGETDRVGALPGGAAFDAGALHDGRTAFYLAAATGLGGRESNWHEPLVTTPALQGSYDPSAVVLSWSAAEPASRVASYSVYYGEHDGALDRVIDAGGATSVRLDSLAAGTWYRFRVTATDDRGNETPPSNAVFEAIAGTGTVRAFDDQPVALLGPGADLGWEPRARVALPPVDWTSGILTLTLDSPLGIPCDCSGAGSCGGDEHAEPVSVFIVTDEACVASPDTCIGWDRAQLELMRAATPMGTDARTGPRVLSFDVTPFREALRGRRTFGVRIPTWSSAGWRVGLALTMSHDPRRAGSSRAPAALASARSPADVLGRGRRVLPQAQPPVRRRRRGVERRGLARLRGGVLGLERLRRRHVRPVQGRLVPRRGDLPLGAAVRPGHRPDGRPAPGGARAPLPHRRPHAGRLLGLRGGALLVLLSPRPSRPD